LDEKYCDVIAKRYIEQVSGADGVSVIRDGVTMKYAEVTADGYDDKYIEQVESYNADLIQHPDEEAIDNVSIAEFMSQIFAQDKQILMMRLEGKSYENIAKELGYHDHTAVIKRMRRLGEAFEKQAGIDCGFADKKVKSSYNKTK
ncbi:MAG: hypothetical protein PHG58_03250, partial [Clostridia bacterium]|nr:hypothetical protein [Clostridia bacterium]